MKTKKGLKITAIILAVLIVAYLLIAFLPVSPNYKGENKMRKDAALPILIAHGGGNREFPDNTLEAFINAYSVDKNVMMETDVSITKDGVVILSHDTTIDRKTDNVGAIIDWNYSDLVKEGEEVDFGYTNPTKNEALSGERKHFTNDEGKEIYPTDVPEIEGFLIPDGVHKRHETKFLATTLEDLILTFPENRINVEIKQGGETGKKCFEAIVALLEKHNAFDRVVLASFHSEMYDTYRQWQKEGKVPDCFMYSPGTDGATRYFILHLLALDRFFTDGMCVFQLPTEELGFSLATKRLVKNAHKHNLAVHYWTINDKEEMRYLIEIGADGIMTDYPHRLAEVYAEYQNK